MAIDRVKKVDVPGDKGKEGGEKKKNKGCQAEDSSEDSQNGGKLADKGFLFRDRVRKPDESENSDLISPRDYAFDVAN